MKLEPVSLDTIAGGAAAEMFERELQRVLNDINDPNTDPEKTRTITLTVSIQPHENREAAMVGIACAGKLAGLRPSVGMLHLVDQGGRRVALGKNPNQIDAFVSIDGGKKS